MLDILSISVIVIRVKEAEQMSQVGETEFRELWCQGDVEWGEMGLCWIFMLPEVYSKGGCSVGICFSFWLPQTLAVPPMLERVPTLCTNCPLVN